MTRAAAIYLGCALMAAWAILRAWDHLRGHDAADNSQYGVARCTDAYVEDDDGVQPPDVYLITLARDDPRVGMYSRN